MNTELTEAIKDRLLIKAFQEGQSNPKIKQLEWKENEHSTNFTNSKIVCYSSVIGCHYVIENIVSHEELFVGEVRTNTNIRQYVVLTLKEAKQMLQQDFENRIKQYLEL